MKEMISNYLKEIKSLKPSDIKHKEDFLKEMLIMIKIFQHERLIHLLVTIFVGIATILFFGFSLLLENVGISILGGITLILFLFYIVYYYFLENSIQELYTYYNKIKK